MKLIYPKVYTDQNQKVFVSFYFKKKRFRIYNGKRIGSHTDPNSFPINQRAEIGNVLAGEIYHYLINGGVINSFRSESEICEFKSDREFMSMALKIKLEGHYSDNYKKTLRYIYESFITTLEFDEISEKSIRKFLSKYNHGVSFNTIRRHLKVLINEAINQGMSHDPMKKIKSRKSYAKLHKPFKDISTVLDEVKSFNENLYLCCLLTYGCLLRPHREIRELTWGDFSEDLSSIHLSGSRNKSGRNRIVPVPSYIRENLIKGDDCDNIFSGKPQALNQDYFKTLWSRFKSQSETLTTGQTLYSFRHSGAIDIFKRTGSLSKLQQAMGHSSLNVSLTYLRGLEIGQLTEEDMPSI